jgi:hypothetical protein
MLHAFKNALFVHYVLWVVAHAHLQTKGWKVIKISISMLAANIFILLLACVLTDDCIKAFILILMSSCQYDNEILAVHLPDIVGKKVKKL